MDGLMATVQAVLVVSTQAPGRIAIIELTKWLTTSSTCNDFLPEKAPQALMVQPSA